MFGIGSNGSLGMGVMMSLQDDFTGNAQSIESSMKHLEGVTDGMVAKVTKGLDFMKKGMMTFAVGLALAAPFIAATDKAADFEQALSNIKAVSGATQQEMAGFKTLAMNAGKDIGFGAVEAAQGIELLAKAGISLETIATGGLRGALTLAKAGELEVGAAAEIASSALFAFSKDNLTVAKSADILAGAANASRADVQGLALGLSQVGAVAAAVGQSFETTTTALAAFAQKGLIGSDAGTSLKTMLNNLQPVSQRELKIFEQLGWVQTHYAATAKGVQKQAIMNSNIFYDQTGKMKSLYEVARILRETTAGLTDQQRQFAFQTIFGTDAIRASLIMYQLGAEGLNDVHKEMSKVTAEMVAQERMNNLRGEWTKFKANMETLAITVGDMFLPVLRAATKAMTVITKAFTSFSQTALGGVILKLVAASATFLMLAGLILALKGAAIAVMAIMPALGASIWGALAPILPIVLPIIAAVWLLHKSWSSFMDVLDGKAQASDGFLGFLQRVGAAMWTVKQVWDSWNGSTFDFGGREAELQSMGVLDQMKALATWVVRAKEYFKEFMEGLGEMFGWLKEQWTGLKKDIGGLFDSLGINIHKLGGKIEWFKVIGKTVAYIVFGPLVAAFTALRWVIEGVAIVIAGISALFYGMYEAVVWAIKGIYNVLTSFNLLDVIGGWWESLKNIGSSIVNGIFEGIKNGWDTIANWIKEKLDIIASWNPFSSSEDISGMQMIPVSGGVGNRVQQRVNDIQSLRSQQSNNYYNNTTNNSAGSQTALVDLHLDGDSIGKAVIDFQRRQDGLY